MDALDQLIRKPTAKLTHIEYAIKESYAYGSKGIAEAAADDLANIDAELAALRARVEALEHLEAVAQDVNEWLKTSAGLKGSAHQQELEAALKA